MFDGNESIDASFEANIIPEYGVNLSELEITHLWDINQNIGITQLYDTQDSVSYEFTIPDVYNLTYSVTIDGDQCNYDASIEFNVGVIADISAPSTICLGNDFIVSSLVDDWSSDHISVEF